MKNLLYLVAGLVLCTSFIGCDKTGYRVTIEIDEIGYRDRIYIETLLVDRGFKPQWKERKVDVPKYPNEVYSFFEKKIDDKPYFFVGALVTYVKERTSDDVVKHFSVRIENWHKGNMIPEIRSEIDRLGDIIYHQLVSKAGKENVKIERKEVSPPTIY